MIKQGGMGQSDWPQSVTEPLLLDPTTCFNLYKPLFEVPN